MALTEGGKQIQTDMKRCLQLDHANLWKLKAQTKD